MDIRPLTGELSVAPQIAAADVQAQTAASACKQAPVLAPNLLATRSAARGEAKYDGYGSCTLTGRACRHQPEMVG